jgi:hypothetical protein
LTKHFKYNNGNILGSIIRRNAAGSVMQIVQKLPHRKIDTGLPKPVKIV